eukprot:TRINITY_DN558_c0_g1_i10.p1 TRINITY_DN558_c0_g1~~TRINITY_DN558_c0_g1_i10.p1  ORF type:complete len:170 (-),score=9.83 TRINITY_DN558_c0_g1_i10:68-577(-)
MGESGDESRSLGTTPTWSVAVVLTILVAVSLLIERSIHKLTEWLHRTKRKPLYQAVEKMKDELMLLGFLSLLLIASQTVISRICISHDAYDRGFYPCKEDDNEEHKETSRKLLTNLVMRSGPRRHLLNSEVKNECPDVMPLEYLWNISNTFNSLYHLQFAAPEKLGLLQ